MKKYLLITLAMFGVYCMAVAQIAVESFDYEDLYGYEVDGYAEGGEGWSGPWTVFEGDYEGYTIDDEGELPDGVDITTTGYRLRGECLTQGTGLRMYRELAEPIMDDGSDLWLSFIIETESWIPDSWSGVSFWSPGGAGEQSLFGKNWGRSLWGIVFRGGNMDSEYLVEDNVPVWMVVKIELSGDDGDDECFMWVNPDPTVEPSTSDADATVTGNLNDGATHIACHFGNTEGIIAYFDEIRLANTFEEAVPSVKVGLNQKGLAKTMSTSYPNPFKSSINIDYKLDNTESVQLDILNINGQKIATLVNETQNSGKHNVKWDAKEYPIGTYFYSLRVGDLVERNKIMLQ